MTETGLVDIDRLTGSIDDSNPGTFDDFPDLRS